jgi:alpha-beta hydrolase superfamily lysophospholipase
LAEARFTIEEYTASDGYRWKYRRYAAVGAIKGHVIGLHGIQSHGGWYEHSCRILADAGFSVSFIDRRGAGLNDVGRGDAPSFRRLLDDIAEFLQSVRGNDTEAKPVFIVAISWGGKLAAALERRDPALVDGLALLCPGFFSRVKLPFTEQLAILACRFFAPRRLFTVPLNRADLFTANPLRQQFIEHDSLSIRTATARFLLESRRLDTYLRFVPRYVRLPVLLMLAEKDRIIDNERTRAYFERFRATDKQVIEYPGAHHTLEFEPDPQPMINDLVGWLNSKSVKSATT